MTFDQETTTNYLTFYVNKKKIIEKNVQPHWTLVYYLRTSTFSNVNYYFKI